MNEIPWTPIVVECLAFAALLLFSLRFSKSTWHVILAPLVLALIVTIAIGTISSWFRAWDAKSTVAFSVTGLVLFGVPLLIAAVAIVVVQIFVRSRAVVSLAAFIAGALAVVPAFLIAHSIACGWVGECI